MNNMNFANSISHEENIASMIVLSSDTHAEKTHAEKTHAEKTHADCTLSSEANQKKLKELNDGLSDLLLNVLRRRYYGEVSFRFKIQDGTIQKVSICNEKNI